MRTLTVDAPSRKGRPAHVSAASGLVRAGDRLYVIADDENHLGVFPATGQGAGSLVRILDGKLPLEPAKRKKRKPDFEALVRLPAFGEHPHGALLALGSGSKPNRCRGVLLRLDACGRLDGFRRKIDLEPLHAALQRRFGVPNIEGALVIGTELVLLQRGNKGDKRNARVRLRLDRTIRSVVARAEIGSEPLVAIEEIDLGAIDGVPFGFSDGAALPDGRMAFTAIAEDTDDSYKDGACRGAALGILSAKGRLASFEPIAAGHKVEGIDARIEGRAVRVVVVTDADDAAVPASMLTAICRG